MYVCMCVCVCVCVCVCMYVYVCVRHHLIPSQEGIDSVEDLARLSEEDLRQELGVRGENFTRPVCACGAHHTVWSCFPSLSTLWHSAWTPSTHSSFPEGTAGPLNPSRCTNSLCPPISLSVDFLHALLLGIPPFAINNILVNLTNTLHPRCLVGGCRPHCVPQFRPNCSEQGGTFLGGERTQP